MLNLKKAILPALLMFLALDVAAQSFNNIEFVENKGQWDDRIRYKGVVSNGAFFITENGFTVLQHNPGDLADLQVFFHGFMPNHQPVTPTDKVVLRSHAYNVEFLGGSNNAKSEPDKIIPTVNNYFLGNDQSKWASSCRLYQAIAVKEIYPNIDIRYYTDNGFLKYDIIVKPGGDPSRIALKYDGIDKMQVKNKEMVLSTSIGELKESIPYSYQYDGSSRTPVTCKYTINDHVVRFDVKGYDPKTTLVIDPQVIFCSFSGSTTDNWGFTATYGPGQTMFGGGIVRETNGFPASPGAFQTTFQGGLNSGASGATDIGIIKLSSDGTSRVYATYVGGSGNDQPHSLIVDPQGNLVIAGRSNSSNYPVNAVGGQEGTGGGYDIVVTKLNAAGTALIGSKKIGGSAEDGVNISEIRNLNSLQRNYGDDGRSEVILDAAGNIYVASSTQSGNFPMRGSPFQNTFGGKQDAVLLKFTPNVGTMTFSSYLGGSENDAGYVLSLAPNGDIYMAGGTESPDLFTPAQTAGTIGPSLQGPIDGYVAVINNSGSNLIRGTFIGTPAIDQVFGVQFDANGFPYIMGQTTGNWVAQNAAYSNAGGKQFISKLRPDLSANVYTTMFGSGAATPNISPIAFLVDRCENVYISGWGGYFFNSNNYQSAGTNGLPITADAFKNYTDGKDFYFFVLKKNATQQLFGSFFGEDNPANAGSDHVDGGTSRFDSQGRIYQAICANCKLSPGNPPLFPYSPPNAWSITNNATNGGGCNMAMLKIDMDLAGVKAGVQSAIDGVIRDTAGCVPLYVTFSDTLANGVTYEWNFGDSPAWGTTTHPDTAHTYLAIGTYTVTLVSVDPNSCNVRDTSKMLIKVGATKALPVFTATRLDPCESFIYQFDNTSAAPPGFPFAPNTFTWDFGDGSPKVTTGSGSVNHQYAAAGTYNVTLLLNDDRYCNSPDDTVLQLNVAANVLARFTAPNIVCINKTVQFTSTSVGADTYLWDFGDGSPTSTDQNPIHTYTTAGPFTVTLTASNLGTCNKTNTTTAVITVFDTPTASATFAPDPPVTNTPTVFNNLSLNAIRYKWLFGDGDSTLTNSLISVSHQYNATGSFNALLIAYNQAGCTDTFPMTVRALIEPALDVPNAFTPMSNDVNSVVMVKGFGIVKLKFTIWNRWGQKVFETSNRNQGWDGKVKGVVQPMDVYAYTLEAEYFDGKKLSRKGDITLIR
ncbi:MAG: PKD domain-containing protein [Chitinophagaceae bacterium]|nr:PKD domain-containing protein [Chitinophagaceae bacterium]MBL0336643.1 PKD domain-containing protein [Chitinophagaceae bacterium]